MVAPAILTAEVLSAVARQARHPHRPLAAEVAETAVAALPRLHLTLMPASAADVERAWALRHNVRPADGLYVALAERLGVPLLTSDRQLQAAAEPAKLACSIIEP
jgi:predicted nucleic acid-binding protein